MARKKRHIRYTFEEKKLTTMTVLAVIMVVFGIILIGTSFFLPPSGEIHPTVLTAFGEMLTFAGSLLGIDCNYRFKVFREKNDRYEDYRDDRSEGLYRPEIEDEQVQE